MTHPIPTPPTAGAIKKAADLLLAGGLVAFPTETVYGLGGDATDDRAVAKIFEAKGRPSFNPLIAHCDSAEAARRHGVFSPLADRLAKAYWPGPFTLVVPRAETSGISLLASAGLDTVALRVPGHPIARALLAAAGRPIAAPSANLSGQVSPTEAAHVADAFNAEILPIVLDGGACEIGLESTVVAVEGDTVTILRPGAVTEEMLRQRTDDVRHAAPDGPISAPGMLASHYAPSLPVRLDAETSAEGEGYLAYGTAAEGPDQLSLSPSRDLAEAAANLFRMLRALDRPGLSGIAVAPIPEEGLGRAINDRLRRAAAPRHAPS